MEHREPLASREELERRIMTAEGAPAIDLGSHGTAHVVVAGQQLRRSAPAPQH